MAFAVKRSENVGDGLARVAKKTLSKAIEAVDSASTADAIHAVRKSTKKVRAIMVLVESRVGHTRRVEKRLRRIGRSLSPLRDAHAVLETFGHLAKRAAASDRDAFDAAGRVLQASSEQLDRAARRDDLLADARRSLKRARRDVRDVHLDDGVDLSEVVGGVKRAYRRGRRAMAAAADAGTADEFHQWRKRVKTLLYEVRLLAPHLSRAGVLVRAVRQLEEWLGEDHNVAVLRDQLANDRRLRMPARREPIERLCIAYQAELRQKALALGQRVYTDAPKQFIERLTASRHKVPRLKAAA